MQAGSGVIQTAPSVREAPRVRNPQLATARGMARPGDFPADTHRHGGCNMSLAMQSNAELSALLPVAAPEAFEIEPVRRSDPGR